LVCDDVENCGTESSYEASMVCGGELCPNAVEVWEMGLMSMHKGMAIRFSGDAEVDFVRGMIPHHLGAVDMCSILVETLMCNDFRDVGGIDGMVHFCNHVRKEQEREVFVMESWLESAGFGRREDCPEEENSSFSMSDGGCGDTASPSSVAFIEANHAMHAGMGIRVSCDHSVDFVRAMIPHHAGAVRMCEILQEHSDASSLDSTLRALCQNITKTQRAEIAYLSEWLDVRGHSTIAPCMDRCCPGDQPLAPAPSLPCEDTLSISSFCHQFGGDSFCSCGIMTDTHACGSEVRIDGFGMLVVDAECKRHCGLCPLDRAPLFYTECPESESGASHDHRDLEDSVPCQSEKTYPNYCTESEANHASPTETSHQHAGVLWMPEDVEQYHGNYNGDAPECTCCAMALTKGHGNLNPHPPHPHPPT
jgi:uncharacterized protein (DUF305 family)